VNILNLLFVQQFQLTVAA